MSKTKMSEASEKKRIRRLDDLLRISAKHFRDCSDPFNADVLSENDVTADEVFDLSNSIASAIDFYLRHKEQATNEAVVKVVSEELGAEMGRLVAAHLAYEADNRALTRALAKKPLASRLEPKDRL